jgi:hypothetical protein
VYDGVNNEEKLYNNEYVIMILIGTLKGNGDGFKRLFERLIRGVWKKKEMELMKKSLKKKE